MTILIWFLIGLVTALGLFIFGLREEKEITAQDIGILLICFLLGPIGLIGIMGGGFGMLLGMLMEGDIKFSFRNPFYKEKSKSLLTEKEFMNLVYKARQIKELDDLNSESHDETPKIPVREVEKIISDHLTIPKKYVKLAMKTETN